MTDRDELSTADLASQEPNDTTARHAAGRDADPRDDDSRDVDPRDVDPRDADSRDVDPRDVGPMDAGPAGAGRDPLPPAVAPDDEHGDVSASADRPTGTATAGPLLASRDAEGFRARWTDVQTAFVDSPRQSVEQADALVAEVMQHLAKTFADERSGLERQWDRGDDIATDDLRTAFQRYRSFFERLLST